MNSFAFSRPPLIHFGAGKIAMLPQLVQATGGPVLIVTGERSLVRTPQWAQVNDGLRAAGVVFYQFSVSGEPTVEQVDRAVEMARSHNIKSVAAIGGGSVIDAGKAVAAMLKEDGSVRDYLESVGSKKPSGCKVPFMAVPTTAGTGSEATKNAVISQAGPDGFKKSLRHDNYMPDVALVDPELSLTCPSSVTAACGMDALTQLLEAYVSTHANPITDALAESGLVRITDNLAAVCGARAEEVEARAGMAYAALVSGIVLANAGLGVVHGFASSIGGMFNVPHGVICGTLAGPATRVTIDKLRQDNSDEAKTALRKYAVAGWRLSGKLAYNVTEGCETLVACLLRWRDELHIPRLAVGGIVEKDFENICRVTESKNNPAMMTQEDLLAVLRVEQ
jgi:alcohol dehydrogenase class IV